MFFHRVYLTLWDNVAALAWPPRVLVILPAMVLTIVVSLGPVGQDADYRTQSAAVS